MVRRDHGCPRVSRAGCCPDERRRVSDRVSIQPTYDHRETGDRFYVETTVGHHRLPTTRIPDPFVNHTITIGWRDLLRGLLHRRLRVTVYLGGDPEIVEDVCELNSDYLGLPRSSRRREWNQHIQDSLARLGEDA